MKDKNYESKIKNKIDKINMEIRSGYFNVIYFMRASPIVDLSGATDSIPMRKIGFETNLSSSFRSDVFEALTEKNKVLYLKFDNLTRTKLKDSLLNGCRILQLNCAYTEDDCLCVEGPYGRLERLPFNEIRDLFSAKTIHSDLHYGGQGEQKILDVLVLAAKNSLSLGNFFAGLDIPHVIAFDFSSDETDFRHKVYQNECIDKFCMYFYEELIMQESVVKAFEAAKDKVLNYLGAMYFEGIVGEDVNRIIGQGPVLLPEEEDHLEVLFSDSHFTLVPGRVEDISFTRHPNNIKKVYLPFTGRKLEMYEVCELACKTKGFINLYGDPGIGKTSFVLDVGYYLLTRSPFVNGIYYIPLKKLKANVFHDYEIKDLIKDTIGIDIQSVIANSFKGKSMLLIFDDFDIFEDKDVEFPRLFFKTLKECGIACIFVHTTNKIAKQDAQEDNIQFEVEEMNRKQKQEEIEQLLKDLPSVKLGAFTEDELTHILYSFLDIHQSARNISFEKLKENPAIKAANGNPKALIKALIEKTIKCDGQTLEINPSYVQALYFEQEYLDFLNNFTTLNMSQPSLSKQTSSVYYDSNRMVRMPSGLSEHRLHLSTSHPERKASRDIMEGSKSPFYASRTFAQNRLHENDKPPLKNGHFRNLSSRHARGLSNSEFEGSPKNPKKYSFNQGVEIRRFDARNKNPEYFEEEKVPLEYNLNRPRSQREEKFYHPPSITFDSQDQDEGEEGRDSFPYLKTDENNFDHDDHHS